MSYPRVGQHEGEAGGGASLPQRFQVDGLGMCAVKFAGSRHGPRALCNELIGFGVADVLDIEHPAVGVVEVEGFLLPKNGLVLRDDWGDSYTLEAGLHFYSQWLEPSDRVTASELEGVSTVRNASMLAGIVLLDMLIGNWDRSPQNPNLLIHRAGGRNRLTLIDLGFAFGGYAWQEGNLKPYSGFEMGYFPKLRHLLPYDGIDALLATVNPVRDFSDYVGKLKLLTRDVLEGIIERVPPEWGLSLAERSALVDYLEQKAQLLPEYLEARLKKEQWWL